MECTVRFLQKSGVLCVAALLLVGLAGCSSQGAKTTKVTGKVATADGSPVKGANLSFQGTGSKAYQANGTTKDDGSYTVSTFSEGDGAVPGDYAVTISDAEGVPMTIDGKPTVTVGTSSTTLDFKVTKGTAPPPAAAATDAEPPATP